MLITCVSHLGMYVCRQLHSSCSCTWEPIFFVSPGVKIGQNCVDVNALLFKTYRMCSGSQQEVLEHSSFEDEPVLYFKELFYLAVVVEVADKFVVISSLWFWKFVVASAWVDIFELSLRYLRLHLFGGVFPVWVLQIRSVWIRVRIINYDASIFRFHDWNCTVETGIWRWRVCCHCN